MKAREESGLVSQDVYVLLRFLIEAVSYLYRIIYGKEMRLMADVNEKQKRNMDIHNSLAPIHILLVKSQGRSQNRTKIKLLLDYRTAVLDHFLTEDVTRNVMEKCLVGFCTNCFRDKRYNQYGHVGARCLKAVLF